MGWLERQLKSAFGNKVDITTDNPQEYYDVKSIGNLIVPEKITDLNAFTLCNSVAELYFPVDFYADRISKLRFFIADKNGKEIENTELNRFINNINPFYTFNDLMYQYVFSYLADGNAYSYTKSPIGKKSVNNITRLDILNPNKLTITENLKASTLTIENINEIINKIQYSEGIGLDYLEKDNFTIDNYSMLKRVDSLVRSKSSMMAANKSIDTLLTVYSARYNIYANNGSAGYLARKTNATANDLSASIEDPITRESILKEINDRNGLTGKRNLWGISSVPIEFINTLANIQALQPFDETLEDSIKIAAVLQIPSVLVPRKDQSTFDNQNTAERSVWENGLLSMKNTTCQNITKILTLDKAGYKIDADTKTVSALKSNESVIEDINTKKIANLEKLINLTNASTNKEINIELQKIIQSYGNR